MAGRAQGTIPDVIIVKKSYPNARKKSRKRNWKLKGLAKEEEVEAMKTKADKAKADEDLELFLRDIEEDPELRTMINLYKGNFNFISKCVTKIRRLIRLKNIAPVPVGGAKLRTDQDEQMGDDDEEPEADFPEISMDELLDDMEGMAIVDQEGDQIME
jgi:nonsense-mediated mRNA decay protein 3